MGQLPFKYPHLRSRSLELEVSEMPMRCSKTQGLVWLASENRPDCVALHYHQQSAEHMAIESITTQHAPHNVIEAALRTIGTCKINIYMFYN